MGKIIKYRPVKDKEKIAMLEGQEDYHAPEQEQYSAPQPQEEPKAPEGSDPFSMKGAAHYLPGFLKEKFLKEPATGVEQLSGYAYGMGKGAQDVAQTVNPDAPDMPDIRIGKNRSPSAEFLGEAETPLALALGAKGVKQIGKGINYLQPGKEAEKFRLSLSEGTAGENIENLSKIIAESKKKNIKEALAPKKELMKAEGKSNVEIREKPPLPNLEKISKVFGEEAETAGSKKLEALAKEVKSYYNHGDIDKLVEKAEGIYNHEGLNEKEIEKLTDLLPTGKLEKSSYMKLKDSTSGYNDRLNEAHAKFAENHSVRNADTLIKRLNEKMRPLIKQEKARTLDSGGRQELDHLRRNHKAVLGDMEDYVATLPKEQQGQYKDFRKMWSENVEPYRSSTAMANLSNQKLRKMTPTKVNSEFAFSNSPEIHKILSDIGEEGKNKILYNHLLKVKPKDAEGMANALLDAKHKKGMEALVTPEMEKWATKMLHQVHINRALHGVGFAALGEQMFGHAGLAAGAVLPYAWQGGKASVKALAHMLKR